MLKSRLVIELFEALSRVTGEDPARAALLRAVVAVDLVHEVQIDHRQRDALLAALASEGGPTQQFAERIIEARSLENGTASTPEALTSRRDAPDEKTNGSPPDPECLPRAKLLYVLASFALEGGECTWSHHTPRDDSGVETGEIEWRFRVLDSTAFWRTWARVAEEAGW